MRLTGQLLNQMQDIITVLAFAGALVVSKPWLTVLLILANACVEAIDTHQDLLAGGGRCAKLFELQAAGSR